MAEGSRGRPPPLPRTGRAAQRQYRGGYHEQQASQSLDISIDATGRTVTKEKRHGGNSSGGEKHVMCGLEDVDRVLEVMIRVLLPIYSAQTPQ